MAGAPLLASAAMNRMLHHAHVLEGDSYRNPPPGRRCRPWESRSSGWQDPVGRPRAWVARIVIAVLATLAITVGWSHEWRRSCCPTPGRDRRPSFDRRRRRRIPKNAGLGRRRRGRPPRRASSHARSRHHPSPERCCHLPSDVPHEGWKLIATSLPNFYLHTQIRPSAPPGRLSSDSEQLRPGNNFPQFPRRPLPRALDVA